MKRKTLGIILLGLFAFGIGGMTLTASLNNEVSIVHAADEEPPITEGTSEDDTAFWEGVYNTYLMPIFGTVTITSIASATLSIIVAVANRKSNKKNIVETRESIANALIVVNALASSVDILLKAIQEGNTIAEETKQTFIDSVKVLLKNLALLMDKTQELTQFKPILITLSEIQGKIALASKELVAAGIGESVNVLVEQVKHL